MDISEFFRANTPPIFYHRIPDGGVELIDGCICLTNPPEYHELNKSASLREQSAAYHKFYFTQYTGVLVDNAVLSLTLSLIDNMYAENDFSHLPHELLYLGFFCEQDSHPHNRIEYVYRMVRELYATYMCFKHIVWHDSAAYTKLLQRIIIPYNQKREEPYQIRIHSNPNETCWEYLRHSAKNFNTDSSGIFTTIQIVENKVVEHRIAYTLAEALLYQLLLHISAGEEGLNGCKLAECELCHKPIIKQHGNKRFCNNCSKNHVRVAAYRSKKKGNASNAQESNP